MEDNTQLKADRTNQNGDKQKYKVGFLGLTAICYSMMVGGGIYNIAQTTAAQASLGATIISWMLCGVGIISLILTFTYLGRLRPDLDKGIYQYAGAFGGKYLGFNAAWGYWLTIPSALVGYCVMLNDSTGAFFPRLLEHGLPTLIFGLVLIWGMGAIMMTGSKSTTTLNTLVTIMKVVIIGFIVVVLCIYSKVGAMTADFWGKALHLGSLEMQIKSDMAMCIWCFIGIEGAVMMTARAKRVSDVPKASVSGFILALILYTLVSALCFGIMNQPELAKLPNPSMAYVLKEACGEWAYYFVIGAVMFSILGSWIAWTLVCVQALYGAAVAKIMPKQFMRINSKEVPHIALLMACAFMSVLLLIVCFSDSLFMAAVKLTSVLTLPCYLFCALYLFKLGIKPQKHEGISTWKIMATSIVCIIFSLWILYSAGLVLLMTSSILYLSALGIYIKTQSQYAEHNGWKSELFRGSDRIVLTILILAAIASIITICCGVNIF